MVNGWAINNHRLLRRFTAITCSLLFLLICFHSLRCSLVLPATLVDIPPRAGLVIFIRFMDFEVKMSKISYWVTQIGNLWLHLLWHLLHLIVSAWFFAVWLAAGVEGCLISSGILKHYNSLNLDKLRNLAIVIESEEAYDTSKVVELLKWLKALGVNNVCLYDAEGVLNKSKEAILERINDKTSHEVASLVGQRDINITFASISDGKEAIVKAANVLFSKYCTSADLSQDNERIFSEQQINEALLEVGCGGPKPELLLVYGPARCHLGFPPWRIPYTEIVHMGSLKSMNYGSLVKAMFKFTKVRQNYGK